MTAIAILRLQRAGFTEEQVEALAEFSEAGTATRSDIARLEAAISDLDHKIDAVRSDLGVETRRSTPFLPSRRRPGSISAMGTGLRRYGG